MIDVKSKAEPRVGLGACPHGRRGAEVPRRGSDFDFTSIIQKPASSSLVSAKGPSVTVRFDPRT